MFDEENYDPAASMEYNARITKEKVNLASTLVGCIAIILVLSTASLPILGTTGLLENIKISELYSALAVLATVQIALFLSISATTGAMSSNRKANSSADGNSAAHPEEKMSELAGEAAASHSLITYQLLLSFFLISINLDIIVLSVFNVEGNKILVIPVAAALAAFSILESTRLFLIIQKYEVPKRLITHKEREFQKEVDAIDKEKYKVSLRRWITGWVVICSLTLIAILAIVLDPNFKENFKDSPVFNALPSVGVIVGLGIAGVVYIFARLHVMAVALFLGPSLAGRLQAAGIGVFLWICCAAICGGKLEYLGPAKSQFPGIPLLAVVLSLAVLGYGVFGSLGLAGFGINKPLIAQAIKTFDPPLAALREQGNRRTLIFSVLFWLAAPVVAYIIAMLLVVSQLQGIENKNVWIITLELALKTAPLGLPGAVLICILLVRLFVWVADKFIRSDKLNGIKGILQVFPNKAHLLISEAAQNSMRPEKHDGTESEV